MKKLLLFPVNLTKDIFYSVIVIGAVILFMRKGIEKEDY